MAEPDTDEVSSFKLDLRDKWEFEAWRSEGHWVFAKRKVILP